MKKQLGWKTTRKGEKVIAEAKELYNETLRVCFADRFCRRFLTKNQLKLYGEIK